jgi:uncharacterized protein
MEVRKQLEGESSGNDLYHAFRVRDVAVRIASATHADVEVVEAAALLHDIGHKTGRTDHARRSATLGHEILLRCGFPEALARWSLLSSTTV